MFIFTFQHLLWASRLHGNVESVAILSFGPDNRSKERDSIILAFQDAKISVVEYNDSIHGLCTRYAHLWHNILFFLIFSYGSGFCLNINIYEMFLMEEHYFFCESMPWNCF